MTVAVIAEDEPVLRGELRETLTRLWPGLEIATEAEEGIEALERCKPQVMFLDIEMPGTCPGSRSRAGGERTLPCRLRHRLQPARSQRVRAGGGDDYVMKPFNAGRLATAITRVRERLDAKPARLDGLLQALPSPALPPLRRRQWIRNASASHVPRNRIDAQTALPLQVIGREQIGRSGVQTVEQLLDASRSSRTAPLRFDAVRSPPPASGAE